MELVKEQIQMEMKKGTAFTQVTFDEAYNLPDYLPDIYSAILSRGEVRLDETRAGKGHVMIRGSVKFKVLYRTDQTDWKIGSLEGEIPFQETLAVDDMDEFDMVRVDTELEDLSIQIINSRKLNIRALLELKVTVSERYDVNLPVSIEEEDDVEMLRSEQEYLKIRYQGKEQCHVREEIRIPSNKPNIRQLLWQQAQMFGTETRLSDGVMLIQGEIQVFVTYVGEEVGNLQWFVTKIPWQCSFDIPEADIDAIPYVSVRTQNLACSVANDEDGESRVLLVDADILADVRIYEEQDITILQDAYALDRQLLLDTHSQSLTKLHRKNESRCRVNETIRIQNPDSDILQICAGFGEVGIDRKDLTADGMMIDGAVRIQLLYLTNNDNTPIEAVEDVIPFHHVIEIPGVEDTDEIELQNSLDALSFLMKSGREVEVQAVVNLQILAILPERTEVIDSVREDVIAADEIRSSASIVGVTVSPTDTLWQIAKQYHTTVEQIIRINQLESDQAIPGSHLLLIKHIPAGHF